MSTVDAIAGKRDRLVTIQQLTESKGASNYPIETWTTLVEDVWFYKEDASGRERFAENQVSAPFDTIWSGPWMDAMDPELVDVPKRRRLVVKGRVHDIVRAKELGRRGGIELTTLSGGLLT